MRGVVWGALRSIGCALLGADRLAIHILWLASLFFIGPKGRRALSCLVRRGQIPCLVDAFTISLIAALSVSQVVFRCLAKFFEL